MSAPRVAVVLPVRDGAEFLAEALASVRAQTLAPAEIVVVDDGSTDATAALAAATPGVRVVAATRRGPAAARNVGIAATTAEWLAFLDHDDLWAPDKLAVQAALAARTPPPDVVVGRTVRAARVADGAPFVPVGAPYRAISFGAALVRRAAFARIGPVDEERLHGEDVAWFGRAAAAGLRIVAHDDVVQTYRRHGRNLTNDAARNRAGFFDALRDAARSRAEGAAP